MVFVVFICISLIISGPEHFFNAHWPFYSINCNLLPIFLLDCCSLVDLQFLNKFQLLVLCWFSVIQVSSLCHFLTLREVSFHPSNFNSVFQVRFLIAYINEGAFGMLLVNQFLSTKFVHQEFETTG